MHEIVRKPGPALPATVKDLLASRKLIAEPTLNDHVETLHVKLWDDPTYKRLWDAVWDEESSEGSLSLENGFAAARIREQAVKDEDHYIAERKLATIIKALNVVLRRYGISRKERRNMIEGEIVPNGNED